MVDLQREFKINSVIIYNVAEQSNHWRIEGAEIRVGNVNAYDQNPACAVNLTAYSVMDTPCIATGRYIFIVQLHAVSNKCLHFSEIEIFAHACQERALRSYASVGRSIGYFSGIRAIDMTPDGGTIVTCGDTNTIQLVDRASGIVSTLAGNYTLSAVHGSQDGMGTSARFKEPKGIRVTPNGQTVVVADSGNHMIRLVDLSTSAVSTLAGSTTSGSQDGVGTLAGFNNPFGVAVTPNGSTVVVADSHMIRLVDLATGTVSTLAGSNVSGMQDGIGADAGFNKPERVVVTPDGSTVVVADTQNYVIRLIDIASGAVSTLAGNGTGGLQDGVGTFATFAPHGLALSPDGGTLVVSDAESNLIRTVAMHNRTKIFSTIEISESTLVGLSSKFEKGVLAPNGKLYFGPFNADAIGVLDPQTNAFSLIDISAIVSTNSKFGGPIVGSNGNIFLTPWDTNVIGMLTNLDQSWETGGYTVYETGGCSSRNELGVRDTTLLWCRALCDRDPFCVSFEYAKHGRVCATSTSCTYALSKKNVADPNRLYLKIANGSSSTRNMSSGFCCCGCNPSPIVFGRKPAVKVNPLYEDVARYGSYVTDYNISSTSCCCPWINASSSLNLIDTSGLHTPTNTLSSKCCCNSTNVTSIKEQFTYWGSSFTIFGNRSTNISEIEIISSYPGKQNIWIYTINCSDADAAFCTLKNQENTTHAAEYLRNNTLNLTAWKRVPFVQDLFCANGAEHTSTEATNESNYTQVSTATDPVYCLDEQVLVPETLSYTVKLAFGVPVLKGQTRAFLVVSSSGVKYALHEHLEESCPHLSGDFCEAASDSFISVMVGAAIMVETEPGSIVPARLVSYLAPRFHPGKIGYITHSQHTDYECVFQSGSDARAKSSPTKSFAVSLDQVDAARDITCLSPRWPYGQRAVNISLARATGSNPVADTDRAQDFMMLAFWTDVHKQECVSKLASLGTNIARTCGASSDSPCPSGMLVTLFVCFLHSMDCPLCKRM